MDVQRQVLEKALFSLVVEIDNRSRFLELPAELRNTVYELLFEDDNDKYLDVFLVKRYLPRPAIRKVSHQIRRESIEIFNEVTKTFWENHVFCIQPRNFDDLTVSHRQHFRFDCDQIPSKAGIPRLRFRLVAFPVPYDDEVLNYDVEIDVGTHTVVPLFLASLYPSAKAEQSNGNARWRLLHIERRVALLSIPAFQAFKNIEDEDVPRLGLRTCVDALVALWIYGDQAGFNDEE